MSKIYKTVEVFNAERYDDNFPSNNLVEFVEWIGGLLEEVPKEFRSSATIEIDSISSYEGCSHAKITIEYERPETDEETAERLDIDKALILMKESQERAILQALKNKYER